MGGKEKGQGRTGIFTFRFRGPDKRGAVVSPVAVVQAETLLGSCGVTDLTPAQLATLQQTRLVAQNVWNTQREGR